MKKAFVVVLLFGFAPIWARDHEPAPEILGVRLGMDHSVAHSRLAKLGRFQSQDEGQEVWALPKNKRFEYLIVGFDREHTVRYVTALARPRGAPVDYSSIGNLASAEHSGTAGNLRYIWKPKKHDSDLEYLVIARGQESHRLTMYSVKRLGTKAEADGD